MSGYLPNDFNLKLASECATAYSESTGLGCTVSDTGGAILFEAGYGCASCKVCGVSGIDKESCNRSHAYGMTEAERFGGKYIYFCPMGLTCFVSPIIGDKGSAAKITVGPFLMVDREDFIEFDLKEKLGLDGNTIGKILEITDTLAQISAHRVNSLSIMLFMAAGFMNNVYATSRMLEIQDSDGIQGQITEYIMELKADERCPEYPVATESELISSIAALDKQASHKLLNELLGYILFSSGGDFAMIKSRIYELLVIISRAAVNAGAPPDETFKINHRFFQKSMSTVNIDELCMLLADVMNKYIDNLFDFHEIKNADIIRKAVHYIRRNCTQKVTLEDVANTVYLSPTYFGKVFKQEMSCSFNTYLNRLRIEKSMQLLRMTNLRLVDIANMSGFEDQSYFTKVFKKITGVSPNRYRKSGVNR